ncbi:MAG TPA: hypothetical protein VEH29_07115 [Acidimicrobiales bacterium]|nr:hypothetical protein [Acidimicrobiales bacterium]
MANDGASSMSNLTAIDPGTNAPQRHVGLPVRDTTSGTVITAEIPAVRAGPSYGVLLPDGSVWYPGSRKRLPAPLILRVVVWILAFAVFFAAAGDFIIRYHPSWVAPLRHIVPAQTVVALSGGSSSTGTKVSKGRAGSGATRAAVVLMSQQPADWRGLPVTGYVVRGSSYSVRVTAGPNRVWVSGQSYADGQVSGAQTAQILQSAGQSLSLPSAGGLLVIIGAGGTTISVYRGAKEVATVPTPTHCPCNLLFEPSR